MMNQDTRDKVCIVAIGTELTTGEIINRNASWLSGKLLDLGFEISLHITVPDDRSLIQRALAEASANSRFVFVTGGLGPTSDDFTREEIAKFCNKPLVWNEAAWEAVTARLKSVGAPLALSNKQQCYFPDGAEILLNSQGTAAAFCLEINSTEIFVLPGPPTEILAIWKDHLEKKLMGRIPPSKHLKLHRFICLGMSESRLGEVVEETLTGSNLLIGYRTRMPYVDVKVWTHAHEEKLFIDSWAPKLQAALGTHLLGRDDFDAAESCTQIIPKLHSVEIVDTATGGHLARRIFQALDSRKVDTPLSFQIITSNTMQSQPTAQEVITLSGSVESGEWSVERKCDGKTQVLSETTRYKGALHKERFQSYVCERALVAITNWWGNDSGV